MNPSASTSSSSVSTPLTSDNSFTSLNESFPPATAKAFNGAFEIVDVVCQGYVELADGTKEVYAHVKWQDSLVPRKDVVWSKPVPKGLNEESLKLIRTDYPGATAVAKIKCYCSFCTGGFTTNSSRRKHERKCGAPGGPNHECAVGPNGCEPDCAGRVPYVPTEDLRKYNGRKHS